MVTWKSTKKPIGIANNGIQKSLFAKLKKLKMTNRNKNIFIDYIAQKRKIPKNKLLEVYSSAKDSLKSRSKKYKIMEGGKISNIKVKRCGVGPIKTQEGKFLFFSFILNDRWKNYDVLIKCNRLESCEPIFEKDELFLRIDSGCRTGHVFGDLTCDCSNQLRIAMKELEKRGEGIIIHIPSQDGRGTSLPHKLATLKLQEELGLDTVEAARLIHNSKKIDKRTYAGVIAILKFFNINDKKINIGTNNPWKISIFKENRCSIEERIPIKIKCTKEIKRHLLAKQNYLEHINLL